MRKLIQQILSLWLALFAAMATAPVQAQSSYMSDIDIYSTSSSSTVLPNVLIVLDNTGNWSSPFNREMAALYQVVSALPANKFRLGLMMFTETGGSDKGPDGAYVRAAMRKLDDTSGGGLDYKNKLLALFNTSVKGGLDVNNDKSNAGKAAWTMAEAYYYFAQKAPYAGNQKAKTDYTGNNTLNNSTYAASQAIYDLAGNALSSKNATQYQSFPQDACAGNYIIWISNGATQDPISDNTSASTALTNAYTALGLTRPADITGLSPNGSEVNVADEWARFMRRSTPQAVTTFTLDIDPDTGGQGPGWSALLASMAVNSNGEYFKITNSAADAGAKIAAALGNIFNQIMATNSTFASASLPVSVNARGAYLNQVFMGMFRPDTSAKPRWRGNLKQYKFGYDPLTDTLRLEDSTNAQAVSGSSGFINPSAVSYWTAPSTFFTQDPMGTPASASDSPDGEVVEKGGVAQRLRSLYGTSQVARRMYTCLSGSCNDLTVASSSFVATNTALVNSLFNLANNSAGDAEKADIINWTRGANNVANDAKDVGPGGTVTVRPSIHGDVLHSRPAVVNYGPTGTNNVVVFYGTNDGALRAVNGNQVNAQGTVGPGEEFWAYMPQEHFPKLKRLRDNAPEVKLSTSSATGTTPRDYFVDGPIGLYQKINSSGTSDRVILYVGMRRGGRTLYAIDVTNLAVPKVLWKKSNTDLSNLGQTWSEARVAKVKGYANPVVIMGGGYDEAGEDPFTPTSSPTMGNAIFVFDAFDGTKLAEFPTTRSVPADVSLMDSDYDGYVDRAYASDVHGNIYRIDFEVTMTCGTPSATCGMTKDDWIMRQVASLSTSTLKRKVFYPPDVVLASGFAAILVGTGDREKPLCGQGTKTSNCPTTADGFYTVYDTVPARPAKTYTRTATTVDELGAVGTAASKVAGCVIPMSTAGEKIINAPLTVAGYTYFSTNTPDLSQNACTGQLGTAKVYGAKVFCQGAISEIRTGGGMPPSPVSGVVSVTYTDRSNPDNPVTVTKQVPFVIGGVSDPNAADPTNTGADSGCGLAGCKPKINISPNRTRKYWFVENPR